MLTFHRLSADGIEQKARENLEEARRIHNREIRPM